MNGQNGVKRDILMIQDQGQIGKIEHSKNYIINMHVENKVAP